MNAAPPSPSPLIGKAVNRVDGPLKVTGRADYTSDYSFPGMAWGFLVKSTISKGTLQSLDTSEAEKTPGVVRIYTHENRPALYLPKKDQADAVNTGEELLALPGPEIKYYGQDIAFVIAETYEQAREAASRVKATYAEKPPIATMDAATFYAPKKVDGLAPHLEHKPLLGPDTSEAWNASDVKIDVTYKTPMIHHHPMEPHSAVARWDGDRLTCHTPTQWMYGTRNYLSKGLGISTDRVRVISHYLGGGFGCKGSSWMFLLLTAMAARDLDRPVKFVMEREQMFTSVGYRPETTQRLKLGAKKDGTLSAMEHDSATSVSFVGEFLEATGHRASYVLYPSPHIAIDHQVYAYNLGAPCQMRAPGESPGIYALESAMDELADALNMDPVDLRLKNLAVKQPFTNLPFSSKNLDQAYEVAARSFGWSGQKTPPTREGDWLVGRGMATALYPANRTPATVRVRLLNDGTADVASATHDLGTGTYTIMAQMAGDTLGLPIDKIRVELGDSSLPQAGVSGGSMSAASVLPAVQKASKSAIAKLAVLAVEDSKSPLHGSDPKDLIPHGGSLQSKTDPAKSDSFVALLRRSNQAAMEATESVGPPTAEEANGEQHLWTVKDYAYYSFGAFFAEVRVHALTCEVRVSRVSVAMDIGQPLNLKTARSQVLGGAIFGIGAALTEHSILDRQSGRWITQDLGTYHVPVNADVPEIDVHFVGPPDYKFDPQGARGLGEIGNTGLAAAIGNAVHHATGVRIRELPITPDKILLAMAHEGNTRNT